MSYLAQAASILFAVAFTSSLFDTVIFWSFLYHELPRRHITFHIIHFYILNFLVMLAECVWSLMIIPVVRIISIVVSSVIYVGLYFLWKHINHGGMLKPPHGTAPMELVITAIIVGIYVGAFWVVYGGVRFRDRLYTRGLFNKEETYTIIDSQDFAKSRK